MRFGFFDATITGYDENNMPLFDRAEDSAFFAEMLGTFLIDGIYTTKNRGFNVTRAGGMAIAVSEGECFIKGRFGWIETPEIITLAAADALRNRIDRVVIRLDMNNRSMGLAIKQGEYAASGAVAPDIERDENNGIWELAIADISIPAASTEIGEYAITDKRGAAALCGFVNGIFPQKIEAEGEINVALQDNAEYRFENVTSLRLSLTTALVNHAKCHGFVTFAEGTAPTINISWTKMLGDIKNAQAGETWEFDFNDGYLLWVNWTVKE